VALTQAQERAQAKERVRVLRRNLKKVDTSLEVLERRLDRLLERERLITLEAFDSYLENYTKFIANIRSNEVAMTAVMALFLVRV
jgi:hypothetical protein